jgi:peptidoglycan/LPS O-acetylase OafA/YrhL
MRSANIRYLPQVDHLRAFAALWVLLYHGAQLLGAAFRHGGQFNDDQWIVSHNPLWAWVHEGHTAVALFMVLSGFIFTYGTMGRRIHYGRFIGNRLLRIYPLYLTMIFVSLAVDRSKYSLDSFVSTVLPLANFQTLPAGRTIGMAWAVAVEFQFYLIFPFLLTALNSKPLKTLAGVLAIGLSFRLLAWAVGANPRDLTYFHIVGRIDQFVLGMAAACVMRRRPQWRVFRMLFWGAIPLAGFVLYCFHRSGGWPGVANWKVIWPAMEGFVWALLILGYVGSGLALPRLFSAGLSRIGEISFSIYLLHFPIIDAFSRHPNLLPRITGRPDIDAVLSTLLVVLPCTLAFSWLTFHVIELPFLRRRQKYLLDDDARPDREFI